MRVTWTSKYKPGHPAPPFTAVLQDGTQIDSATLRGQPYVLFFYNHDNSETCTKQTCAVRDEYHQLTKKGYRVFGVSEDSAKKHNAFIKKHALPFDIVVDTGNALARTFDIFGEKLFMGRLSDAVHRQAFVVDEQGIIRAVINPVDAANHGRQLLDAINATQV